MAQIAAIERQCFSSPWPAEIVARSLTGGERVMLVATEGNAVLGYIGMMYVLDEGYISNVAVSTEHRRRGVGGALVEAIESRSRELGLGFLTLEVREGNTPARSLYARHGFTDVGLRRGYYEKPVEDAVLMTLFL